MKNIFLLLVTFAIGCSSVQKPEVIQTEAAPKALGAYSQAIKANGLIFVSGQLGINPVTGSASDDIETQTKQVMENLKEILKKAGVGFDSVVKTTIFLKSIADLKKVNEIYGSYFNKGIFPARSTVEVGAFPKNFLIEIDMTAIVKN
jgi:2-iminobutanoate/2-iminopropanoate deaminase